LSLGDRFVEFVYISSSFRQTILNARKRLEERFLDDKKIVENKVIFH